jgi:hypothetical protein
VLSLKQLTAHDSSVLLTELRDGRRELDASDVSSGQEVGGVEFTTRTRGAVRVRAAVAAETPGSRGRSRVYQYAAVFWYDDDLIHYWTN